MGLLDIAVGIFITDEALSRIVEAKHTTGSQGDFTQIDDRAGAVAILVIQSKKVLRSRTA